MPEDISKPSHMEHLRWLRDDFSDEIPGRIVDGYDKDNKYKARKNWFQGVVAGVSGALDDGEIKTSEGKHAAERLIERFTLKEFRRGERTEEKDIKEANKLIDIVLQEKT